LRAAATPAVLEQRIGRIHRLGQHHPIDVYNLLTEAGIEARIAQLVADKKAFFLAVRRRDRRHGAHGDPPPGSGPKPGGGVRGPRACS
jgi:hypothetical protein